MTDLSARLSPDPLRFVFQRHTRKRIASRFGVSLATARDWLRDGVPKARREELARVVLAELEQIEAKIERFRGEG